MSSAYQAFHEGNRFRIVFPDGREEWMTAKEFLAHRARYNAAFPLTTSPSPGAGSRRLENPQGQPETRPPPRAGDA